MTPATPDWDPETYGRFRNLRLRPALDLIAQVPVLPDGAVIDLGCGTGTAGAALRARWPDRQIIGLDASPAMLEEAREKATGYDALVLGDAASWTPDIPPALIFSNALLHWLPEHGRVFPRLLELLRAGGVLAVQMPRQQMAPSHRLLREIAAHMYPDRFDLADFVPQVGAAQDYHRLLAPLAAVQVWETEYLQRLAPTDEGHPVRHFTQSTALRPIADRLSGVELRAFLAAYDAALADPYPAGADGAVLFPFRRLFLVAVRNSV